MTDDNRLAEELMGVLRAAARDVIEDMAEDIVDRAKLDLPIGDPEEDPNLSLALRNSFSMRWTGSTLVIAVTSPYAIKQHESFYLRHPRGGSPKFLERQFATAGLQLERELGIRVSTYLRSARPLVSRDGKAVQADFAAAGIHTLGDYVEKVMGSSTRPGHNTKSR